MLSVHATQPQTLLTSSIVHVTQPRNTKSLEERYNMHEQQLRITTGTLQCVGPAKKWGCMQRTSSNAHCLQNARQTWCPLQQEKGREGLWQRSGPAQAPSTKQPTTKVGGKKFEYLLATAVLNTETGALALFRSCRGCCGAVRHTCWRATTPCAAMPSSRRLPPCRNCTCVSTAPRTVSQAPCGLAACCICCALRPPNKVLVEQPILLLGKKRLHSSTAHRQQQTQACSRSVGCNSNCSPAMRTSAPDQFACR